MSKQKADWAILVYISADRVLTNFAVESLKQLKRAAGDGIIALAQMQGSAEKTARRFVFKGRDEDPGADLNRTIKENEEPEIKPHPSPGGIADPRNLTQFIRWAYTNYEAKRYCLFLWGHGYELLLNSDTMDSATNPTSDASSARPAGDAVAGRNYLAPKDLKRALKDAGGSLDVIGVDACSLSLLELASELRGCGKFMIASQGDVPDGSFPYEQLLLKLKRDIHCRDDAKAISAAIPAIYGEEYRDYVLGPATGISEITLTTVQLDNMKKIEELLKKLSAGLLSSAFDVPVRKKVLAARKAARDFALGLFVDLHDFCSQLSRLLDDCELKAACDAVGAAIDAREDDDCILANVTRGEHSTRCHGLSVYFPYLTKGKMEETERSLAAGETTTVDQLQLLVKGGTNNLLKARSVQISEIEGDFESLQQFERATGWSKFIKDGWSVIMTALEPKELEQHYSGQQCAENLLSLLERWSMGLSVPTPIPPPGPTPVQTYVSPTASGLAAAAGEP